VARVPLAFLTHINEKDAGLLGLDIGVVNGYFFDAFLGVIDQFEKLRAMEHGRGGKVTLAQFAAGSSAVMKDR
jgi:hypothetical protein